ncbi:hypothetical protein HVPorG_05054 (plasmid) [Roseomonas mucosa]|uniref:hypothetical protein n=1 Tax=Roseomonas mucosa TaxID=207340 RepID=UPI002207851D|nr:hypothetical protein [Roseomonas mucosa]QDJ12280.1 hypothetical protein HVPorG_05054 [Roseomonas mucosa]
MSAAPDSDYLPLLQDQRAALRAYAAEHGRCWKAHLLADWMNATAEPLLHQLRNSHGPTWLLRLKLQRLPRTGRKARTIVSRNVKSHR